MINTAVQGTVGILKSALKAGPQLKSVVYSSSTAAITHPVEPPYTFTEKDWNDWAIEEYEKQGQDLPGQLAYVASKAKAEKAFWAFRESEKPGFSMVSVNPG